MSTITVELDLEEAKRLADQSETIRKALPVEYPVGTLAKVRHWRWAEDQWALARKVEHGWSTDKCQSPTWRDETVTVVEVIRPLPEGYVAVKRPAHDRPVGILRAGAKAYRHDGENYTADLIDAYADAIDPEAGR